MRKTLVVATLLLATLFVFSSFPAFAQTERKKIVMYEDELTSDQLAKSKVDQQIEKYEQYGDIYSKMNAIADGSGKLLSNISTEVNKFADTKVGLFTVIMIFYTVIGNDIIRILASSIVFLLITPLFVWSYKKNCIPRNVLETEKGEGKDKLKTYTLINEPDDSIYASQWSHVICFAVFLIINMLVAFG
jgi:hypothetical protein